MSELGDRLRAGLDARLGSGLDGGRRTLPVDTPEGVRLQLELAGLGERALALALDLVLLVVLYFAFTAALDLTFTSKLPILLIGFVLRHGYFFVFELRWHGQTPGKRLLGLRVVPREAAGLDGRAVLARNLMRDIELFLPLYLLLELTPGSGGDDPGLASTLLIAWAALFCGLPLLNRGRARAGDLVAGTLVVRVPRARLERDDIGEGGRSFDAAQLQGYGEKELDSLAQLLRDLDPTREEHRVLATKVAKTIAARVGVKSVKEIEGDPFAFLRDFYGAQRAYLERQLLFGRRRADKNSAFEAV